MAIDGMILHKEVELLSSRLPIKIDRIVQLSNDDVLLHVHADHKRGNIMISTHSSYNRIHFTKMAYDGNEPGPFVMGLRKYITGGIIEKIEQPYYDRYLVMYIRALNDLYDVKHYRLHIELMGKYANVILVDEDEKIIDALKRIPPFENNKRTIWPGALFRYPDKQDKADPFTVAHIDMDKSLVSQLSGFSPLLQKEFYHRLAEGETFKDIMKEIEESRSLFVTYLNDGSFQYHIIPLRHLSGSAKEMDLDEGFDALYYEVEEKARIKEFTGDLNRTVNRQIKHLVAKLQKLEDSLESAKNADDLRVCGDLLYMAGDLDAKGLDSISVEDYEGNTVSIKLDSRFSVKENANRYYNSYQKKKRSTKYLAEQIAITKDELEYFRSVSEQLEIADLADARMIRDELVRYKYIRPSEKKTVKKRKDKYHLYQIKYRGHLITFGKNNVQNEVLTFKYAKNDYTWFHAQKFHGAHLCVDTAEPDEDLLRFCANVAAYYSKGRLSSSVPVDYCLVKDVKKIKGSKAGLVAIDNYKTIYIDPERPLLPVEVI